MQGNMVGLVIALIIFQLSLFPGLSRGAGSTSENYSLPTSVFSSGGALMESGSFKATGSIGQPPPLMDPGDPPYSSTYSLYPGFWYTLEAAAGCGDLASFAATFGLTDTDVGYNPGCDREPDGDVDGVDLAEYADTL